MTALDSLLETFDHQCDKRQGQGIRAPLSGKLVLNIEASLWGDFLGQSILRYFSELDPVDQIQFQLQRQLFAVEHFPQAAPPLRRFVLPDPGLALVPSLLGIPVVYRDHAEPAPREVVLIANQEDLSSRKLPDFEQDGLMPGMLSCFESMKKRLGASWSVGFPDWTRGPLGTATYLRGYENAMMDLYADPELARAVLDFGLRARKSFMTSRGKLLGQDSPGGAVLWNDDVARENFAPDVYERVVLPFDKAFYEFHERKVGFHSCGDTTPFLPLIKTIGPLEFFHVSAWTNLEEAVKVFHPETPLLVTLHPIRDVLAATPAHIRTRLETIKDLCSDGPYTVMATELMRYRTPKEDLEAIQRALDVAVDVLC